MEVIRLAGYVMEEKLAIAKKHLVPRVRQRAGLKARQLTFSDTTLRTLIDGYAREAGVRNLEKQLNRVARKVALKVLEAPATQERINSQGLIELLGQPVFRRENPQRGVGVVTGLAWTAMGGATLEVEAARVHSKQRGFRLTGQLGEVMRESAEIAYSYIAANLGIYQGDPAFFDETYVHLHVPEGATPKDGPSAGVTMATALLSLARNEPLVRPVAMTGELTLTGRVLPVGGIREKLIAAKRIGYSAVILPAANQRDYDDLPDYVRRGVKVSFVEHFREVVALVFKGQKPARGASS
jgi:ATP-dependent Lon protease